MSAASRLKARRPRCVLCREPLRPNIVGGPPVRVEASGGFYHEPGPPEKLLGYGLEGRFCAPKCAIRWALQETSNLDPTIPRLLEAAELQAARIRHRRLVEREREARKRR